MGQTVQYRACAEWDPNNVRWHVLLCFVLKKKSCNGKEEITMDWTKTGTLALGMTQILNLRL